MPDEQAEPMGLPYVALEAFAVLHGIHPWRTRYAVNAGWLDLARGRVQDGQLVRTIGLWGQAQFWAVYHQEDGFCACPLCPHGVKVPERIEQASLF